MTARSLKGISRIGKILAFMKVWAKGTGERKQASKWDAWEWKVMGLEHELEALFDGGGKGEGEHHSKP